MESNTGSSGTSANDYQVGGKHYNQFGNLQPWDVIIHFDLGFLDGTAVKYLLRWKHKGGKEDLLKAKHYIEKQLETMDAENRQLVRKG